jgi:outer membrane protein W
MLRKLFVLPALGLLLLPAVSQAVVEHDYGFNPGNWELTIGGNGSNDPDFTGTNLGVNGSIGYFISDNLEISVRQSLIYSDVGGGGSGKGSSWDGSTRIAADWHFDAGQWQPFIGANIGYVYGDSTNDTFEAAPEAGVKYFLNTTTFVFLMAEYQFFFDKANQATDTFSDGQFVYTMGLGVKL